jgi:hypothetical protein
VLLALLTCICCALQGCADHMVTPCSSIGMFGIIGGNCCRDAVLRSSGHSMVCSVAVWRRVLSSMCQHLLCMQLLAC